MSTPPSPHSASSKAAPSDRTRLTGIRSAVSTFQVHVVALLVDVLALLVLVVLVWVAYGVAVDVWVAITTRSVDAFKQLSIELLSVFVFIELFHSLVEFMRLGRIRVTHLVDASLAFVLREIWVGMYSGHAAWPMTLSLAAMILALGAVRTAAIVFSPSERTNETQEA